MLHEVWSRVMAIIFWALVLGFAIALLEISFHKSAIRRRRKYEERRQTTGTKEFLEG